MNFPKMRGAGLPSSGVPDGHTNLGFGRLILHHWKDWIFVIILLILEVILQIIHPYKRYVGAHMFVTGELMYPMRNQTVPTYAVPVCFPAFCPSLKLSKQKQRQTSFIRLILLLEHLYVSGIWSGATSRTDSENHVSERD